MSTTYEKLADMLVEELGQDRDELSPTVTFSEIGLDSLTLAELQVIVLEQTGIELEGLTADATLAQAAGLLDAERSTTGAADTEAAA
ncbi:acyl carrier protein [Streptomyces sp. NPDC002067]